MSPDYQRRRYVSFKWWQYGKWLAVILLVTFCLGFSAGFVSGRLWCAAENVQLRQQVDVLR